MPNKTLDQLIEYATAERFAGEILAAKNEYQEFAGELFEGDGSYEVRLKSFFEWYLLDRPLSKKGIAPLGLYIEENRDRLTPEQLQPYEAFLRSTHGIFIVKKVKGDQVVVSNLFDCNKYDLIEKRRGVGFCKKDIFEARIFSLGNGYFFTGTFCYHPTGALKFIQAEAARHLKFCCHASYEKVVQKLSWMSLQWDRSRGQAALADIYRNEPLLNAG